jgi:hypothetical protein
MTLGLSHAINAMQHYTIEHGFKISLLTIILKFLSVEIEDTRVVCLSDRKFRAFT